MELTLGCTTRPWNQFSFEQACESIAEAGYTDVAIFRNSEGMPLDGDSTPEDVARVRRIVEQAGLRPSMLLTTMKLSAPLEEAVADYKRVIDVCADAGITWAMNCGCGQEELFEKYNQLFAACAPYAQDKGVHLTMKPHGGNGMTGKDMVRVVQAVNHPAFSICYDPGNIIFYSKGEYRPETDVLDVREHVTTCIIKDCTLEGEKPDVNILPGEGLVDFRSVLGSLTAAGFRGPLYVECLGGSELEDINARAVKTREFLEGILADLG